MIYKLQIIMIAFTRAGCLFIVKSKFFRFPVRQLTKFVIRGCVGSVNDKDNV